MSTRRLVLTAGALALAVIAAPLRAQQTQDLVVDMQLAYDAAKSQYGATLDAWRVIEKQWYDALEEHEQARRAGDPDRANTALVRALDRARELDIHERRVTAQKTTLDKARAALSSALGDRSEQLNDQLDGARTNADRARVGALLRDVENRRQALDDERGAAVQVRSELLYYPSIQFDPRDTPETMIGKAQLLRAKATEADSSMAQIDREIKSITSQQRGRDRLQGLEKELQRFGDVQAPGAPSLRTPGDVRARPDSAGVARPEVTPEQRLSQLQLLRLQVQEAKRQLLERAATFETRARRIG